MGGVQTDRSSTYGSTLVVCEGSDWVNCIYYWNYLLLHPNSDTCWYMLI